MAFDWYAFLERHSIEYVTSGHNVSKDNIGIKCPWCGDQDPSHHMGINPYGKGFNCWRDVAHGGRNYARLVSALIGCTITQAQALLKNDDIPLPTTDETFAVDMMARLGKPTDTRIDKARDLQLLPEFKPLLIFGLSRTLFLPYLRERDYSEKGALAIVLRFRLHYATSGKFAYRIIIPVYQDGRLVTWTSRTITKDALRYKTLSHHPESAEKSGLPVALMNIKECVLDYDKLRYGGKTLVVTEGPFDAMRITYYGEKYGIFGTCLFSKNALPAQINRLQTLSEKFKEVVILMDQDAGFGSFMVLADAVGAKQLGLPKGISDPAELKREDFRELFRI